MIHHEIRSKLFKLQWFSIHLMTLELKILKRGRTKYEGWVRCEFIKNGWECGDDGENWCEAPIQTDSDFERELKTIHASMVLNDENTAEREKPRREKPGRPRWKRKTTGNPLHVLPAIPETKTDFD